MQDNLLPGRNGEESSNGKRHFAFRDVKNNKKSNGRIIWEEFWFGGRQAIADALTIKKEIDDGQDWDVEMDRMKIK